MDSLLYSYTNVIYWLSIVCVCLIFVIWWIWAIASMKFRLLCKFLRVRTYAFTQTYGRVFINGIQESHIDWTTIEALHCIGNVIVWYRNHRGFHSMCMIFFCWVMLGYLFNVNAGVSKNNGDGHSNNENVFSFFEISGNSYLYKEVFHMGLIRARWIAILNVS